MTGYCDGLFSQTDSQIYIKLIPPSVLNLAVYSVSLCCLLIYRLCSSTLGIVLFKSYFTVQNSLNYKFPFCLSACVIGILVKYQ